MVFANVLEIWNVNRQWDFPIFNDAEETGNWGYQIESKQPFIFAVSILHKLLLWGLQILWPLSCYYIRKFAWPSLNSEHCSVFWYLLLWIIIEPCNLLQVEVVGFEDTSYHEREAVGQLQVCMRVTVPPVTEPLNHTFSLSMSTRPGTAGKFVFAYCSKDVILFSCGPHL